MAAPTLIPRYVLSAPGRPGANDTIGVARIGNGRQGSGLGSPGPPGVDRQGLLEEVDQTGRRISAKRQHGALVSETGQQGCDPRDVDAGEILF